jgi:predicted nucleotidyltransferase
MALPRVEVVEGKARVGGRALVDWVPDAVAALVHACGPRRIVLFGSVARGDDGPHSDIDLLVVVPDDRTQPAARAAVRAVANLPPEVDVVVVSETGFDEQRHRPGTVVRPAVREGRVVYERAA